MRLNHCWYKIGWLVYYGLLCLTVNFVIMPLTLVIYHVETALKKKASDYFSGLSDEYLVFNHLDLMCFHFMFKIYQRPVLN